MTTHEFVESIASGIGVIGGILGIISWHQTRKIQANTIEDHETERRNKKQEHDLYEAMVKKAGMNVHGKIHLFESGSLEFHIAERLVERGKLFRNDVGGYSLRHSSDAPLFTSFS